ncbi:MAG: hypothetical protein JXN60_02395 [Lentisphaerae bacterium]|nr:hypothetical protein [Lentisphaerota bacterium]
MKTRRTTIVTVCVAGIASAWVAYVLFGKIVVRAAYEDRSLKFLNRAIEGRNVHPFELYLELADALFLKCFVGLIALVVAMALLYFLRRKIGSSKRSSQKKENFVWKRAVGLACLVCVSLGALFAVWLLRHRVFVRNLYGYSEMSAPDYAEPVFPGLTEEQISALGWAHKADDHPASSYVGFQKQKPAGKVRVGLFGCSYTQGLETAPGHDIASFLQKQFYSAGRSDVEVVNFGVASYGVHQMYLLWDYLGCQYDLDYVVIFPFRWHINRDNSFLYDGRTFAGVHACFVLDGDELRLVMPVTGGSRFETSRIYHRFIPPWRYWRYDAKAPASIRALLLGDDNFGVNPFYYRSHARKTETIYETYVRLIQKMAENSPALIVVANDDDIYEMRREVSVPNVSFFRSRVLEAVAASIYWAPGCHFSALGNDLRAKELFDFLTGQKNPDLCRLQVCIAESKTINDSVTKSLASYCDVELGIGTNAVASLFRRSLNEASWSRSLAMDFRKDEVVSLLQQAKENQVRFVPLPFGLKDGDSVSFSFASELVTNDVSIGTLEVNNGVVGRIQAFGNGARSLSLRGNGEFDWTVEVREPDYLSETVINWSNRVENLSVKISAKNALEGYQSRYRVLSHFARRVLLFRRWIEMRQIFELKPTCAGFLYAQGKAGQYVLIDKIAEKGPVQLRLTREDGGVEFMPTFLKYEVIPMDCPPFERLCPNPIRVLEEFKNQSSKRDKSARAGVRVRA